MFANLGSRPVGLEHSRGSGSLAAVLACEVGLCYGNAYGFYFGCELTLLSLFPPPGVSVPAAAAGHSGLDQHWVSTLAIGKLGDATNCV